MRANRGHGPLPQVAGAHAEHENRRVDNAVFVHHCDHKTVATDRTTQVKYRRPLSWERAMRANRGHGPLPQVAGAHTEHESRRVDNAVLVHHCDRKAVLTDRPRR